MAKQTVLEEIKTRMAEMKNTKAAELEKINQMQQEARTKIEAEALAMRQATERMDVDAYEEAKNAKRKAQTALDMYNGRYTQIQQQEYISEPESDKVIDSLLAYEAGLSAGFKSAIAEPLRKLAEQLKEYQDAVKDTEDTITTWQRDIHANYLSRGASKRMDKLTGEWTERMETPYPVHRMPYTGCDEAKRLEAYLENDKELYKG